MPGDPYAPPQAVAVSPRPRRATAGRRWALLGVGLFTGPVWGKLVSIVWILGAFTTLSESDGGSPEVLAAQVSSALVAMGVGILVGLLGLILILVALLHRGNRERWFFWSAVVISVLWCVLLFPLGCVVGIPVALVFLLLREEFRAGGASASLNQ